MAAADGDAFEGDEVIRSIISGAIEQSFATMLRAVVRGIARRRPPPGGGAWTDSAIDDLANDIVSHATPAEVMRAAQRAANDREFSGWLRTVGTRYVDDRARETDAGHVHSRINDVLQGDPRFTRTTNVWSLSDTTASSITGAGGADLLRAAWSVATKTVRLAVTETRRQSFASREDLAAVVEAVLRAAGGSLAVSDLDEIVGARFNVGKGDQVEYIDELDDEAAMAATDWDVEVADAVLWIVKQLSADDRRVLVAAADPGDRRELGPKLGCGKTKAFEMLSGAKAKMKKLAAGVGDTDGQIAARVLEFLRNSERGADEHRSGSRHDGEIDD